MYTHIAPLYTESHNESKYLELIFATVWAIMMADLLSHQTPYRVSTALQVLLVIIYIPELRLGRS